MAAKCKLIFEMTNIKNVQTDVTRVYMCTKFELATRKALTCITTYRHIHTHTNNRSGFPRHNQPLMWVLSYQRIFLHIGCIPVEYRTAAFMYRHHFTLVSQTGLHNNKRYAIPEFPLTLNFK